MCETYHRDGLAGKPPGKPIGIFSVGGEEASADAE
jgi:hypothetical protein